MAGENYESVPQIDVIGENDISITSTIAVTGFELILKSELVTVMFAFTPDPPIALNAAIIPPALDDAIINPAFANGT